MATSNYFWCVLSRTAHTPAYLDADVTIVTLTNDTRAGHPSAGDDELDAAAARALKTFGYFWREMTWEKHRVQKGVDLALVKALLTDGPDHEFLWVSDVNFDGESLTGSLDSDPLTITSMQAGRTVEFSLADVYDWMYVREGNVFGGHTLDVLRGRMNDQERADHDATWGYEFSKPGIVNVIPSSNAQRSTTKPDAAIDHPMAGHLAKALTEKLANDDGVDVNQLQNADGVSLLHQMVLAGSASTVKVLLDNGADAQQLGPNGMNAAQLAQMLGWTHLVRLVQG